MLVQSPSDVMDYGMVAEVLDVEDGLDSDSREELYVHAPNPVSSSPIQCILLALSSDKTGYMGLWGQSNKHANDRLPCCLIFDVPSVCRSLTMCHRSSSHSLSQTQGGTLHRMCTAS